MQPILLSVMILTLINGHDEYTEILASSNFCFNAVTLTKNSFHPPYNGEIVGIKLIHNSGGLTCNGGALSHWGCSGKEIGAILIHVTNYNTYFGETFYPTSSTKGYSVHHVSSPCPAGCTMTWYNIKQYNSNSDEIILMSPTYKVTTNDQFKLEYGEACCQDTISDNRGTCCAKVYFLYSYIDHITTSMIKINDSLINISNEMEMIINNINSKVFKFQFEHIEDYKKAIINIENITNKITMNAQKFKNNIDSIINPNLMEYKSWNLNQILHWISQLESGRFSKYIVRLKTGFKSDGINKGEYLPKITATDLREEPFKIIKFMDRKDLSSHFQKLQQMNDLNNNILKREV